MMRHIAKRSDVCLFDDSHSLRVTWEITESCNARCRHCCVGAGHDGFYGLPTEVLLRAVSDMEALGVTAVYLTGGEPLIRRDIRSILSRLSDVQDMKIYLVTNGWLVDRETAAFLKFVGLTALAVSLDSSDRKSHDDFRGRAGMFDRALCAVQHAVEVGVPVRISAIIWEGNVGRIDRLVNLAYELGTSGIVLKPVMPAGRRQRSGCLDSRVLGKAYEAVMRARERLPESFSVVIPRQLIRRKREGDGSDNRCKAGRSVFLLNARGQIAACTWLAKTNERFLSEGTIADQRLGELFQDDNFRRGSSLSGGIGCPFLSRKCQMMDSGSRTFSQLTANLGCEE